MSPMFATLFGDLPRPEVSSATGPEELLNAVIHAQEAAGLEPISDAGFGIGSTPVERWRNTSARSERMVKQAVVGPYSRGSHGDARTVTTELRELAAAGCPYIEVHEPAAVAISTDNERAAFRASHRGLLDGISGAHLSLVITGGSADQIGLETLMSAPFASLGLDLIAGPDNWRLVAAAPREVGIVCGAISTEANADDRPEVLLWAAQYAASHHGRGLARVGLATSGSLAALSWDVATRKLTILGRAAQLAELSPGERALHLDPRAVDIRSAALGHVMRPGRDRKPGGIADTD